MFRAIGFSFVALVVAPGPLVPASSPTQAADAPICAFAKKVLADRPNEFASFKGAPYSRDHPTTTFLGTLSAESRSVCHLFIRSKKLGRVEQPKYSCSKSYGKVADAQALFKRYAAGLRPCFPGVKVEEDTSDPTGLEKGWWWKARTADYELSLSMIDVGIFRRVMSGNPNAPPEFAVILTVEDRSPPKPGAIIPTQK